MAKKRSKVFITLIALVALVAGAALAIAATGNSVSFAKGPAHHGGKHSHGSGNGNGNTGGSSNSNGATDFAVPQGGDPWGTTFDSSGNVWVALPGCDLGPTCASGTFPGKIAEFNPNNNTWTRVYTLPNGFGQPLFLAFDKSGNLWFAMPMSNTIGELTSSGVANQWAVPTAASGPWDVAVDGNGNVWFTEHYTNKIGEFNPVTKQFKEIATPASNSQPYGITVDRYNNIWFTENNPQVAKIGEYTASGQLEEYTIRTSLPGNLLTPHLITIDGNGNPVWSEGWVSSIGRLNLAQAKPGTNSGVTEYTYHPPCATCGSHTSGIAVDHNGVVWFTDSLQSIFGSLNGSTFTFYSTPTGNSHPHDGLNVAPNNVIWFDEEFANKLARG